MTTEASQRANLGQQQGPPAAYMANGNGTNNEAPSKRLRVYQQWQGNETFFCWGHLVAGPNWRASIGTAFLLLAPSGIFLGFVAPYVMRHVHVIIMVFSCLLPALCALFLFLTACRDPGIIPRQEPDEEYLAGRKPRTQEVNVNGHRVVIRYNDTCHFYQPPRAHHCSVNDNCIERFDHHCPWVGTTIGKRNYRTFLLFVYTATVLCLYVIGVCLAQLFVRHNQLVNEDKEAGGDGSGMWGQTLGDVIPALVLMGYCFLFLWFVGGLSGFHCYLTATNQTTYENFRYNHDNRPNPFNRGILANCAEVWCTRVPPSQVDFRAFVDDVKHKPAGDIENQQVELTAPQVHQVQPGAGSSCGGHPELPLFTGGTYQTASFPGNPGHRVSQAGDAAAAPALGTQTPLEGVVPAAVAGSSVVQQSHVAVQPLSRAEAFQPLQAEGGPSSPQHAGGMQGYQQALYSYPQQQQPAGLSQGGGLPVGLHGSGWIAAQQQQQADVVGPGHITLLPAGPLNG